MIAFFFGDPNLFANISLNIRLVTEENTGMPVVLVLTSTREEKSFPARHQGLDEGREARPVVLATPVALLPGTDL